MIDFITRPARPCGARTAQCSGSCLVKMPVPADSEVVGTLTEIGESRRYGPAIKRFILMSSSAMPLPRLGDFKPRCDQGRETSLRALKHAAAQGGGKGTKFPVVSDSYWFAELSQSIIVSRLYGELGIRF